jgi:hypothetical protein
MISHLGAMISVVNGALLAQRFKGITGTVGAACIGDGATSTGAFHEALNQAAVEKLPLILIVANNLYAYSTPNERQFACRSLAGRAAGYGVEGHSVDGTDLAACLEVTWARPSSAPGKRPRAPIGRGGACCAFAAMASMTTRLRGPETQGLARRPGLLKSRGRAFVRSGTGRIRNCWPPGAPKPCSRSRSASPRSSASPGPTHIRKTGARWPQSIWRKGTNSGALIRNEHHLPRSDTRGAGQGPG